MSEINEITITELTDKPQLGEPVNPRFSLDLLGDVEIDLDVVLGRKTVKVKELMSLRQGEVLKLDQTVSEALSIQLNGREIAKGNLVAIDGVFGLRISSCAFFE